LFAWTYCNTAASAKYGGTAVLEAPIGIAARLEPGAWADLRPFLERILDGLVGEVGADERRLTKVLSDMLDDAAGMPRSLLGSDDYGSAARRALAHELGRAGIGPLIAHCSRADRPVPGKKWFAELDRLVGAAPTALDLAQRALDLFLAAPTCPRRATPHWRRSRTGSTSLGGG
jgi:hypothetical protein